MWKWIQRAKTFILQALGKGGKPVGKPQRLAPKAQEALSSANVDDHAASLKALTKQWADGKLAVGEWHAQARLTLKNAYIQNYLLGIGGKGQMDAKGRGSCGGMLKEQYKHLKGFADELAAGKVSPAQAEARIKMYANSAREAHERGRARAWAGAGEERWVRNPRAESCPDCVAFENEGWQRVGHFPIPGSGLRTRCLTNCMCTLLYR